MSDLNQTHLESLSGAIERDSRWASTIWGPWSSRLASEERAAAGGRDVFEGSGGIVVHVKVEVFDAADQYIAVPKLES